jgi:hypothetical protein
MTAHPTRSPVKTAALALGGIVAITAAASTGDHNLAIDTRDHPGRRPSPSQLRPQSRSWSIVR